jgi:hypothetical protein
MSIKNTRRKTMEEQIRQLIASCKVKLDELYTQQMYASSADEVLEISRKLEEENRLKSTLESLLPENKPKWRADESELYYTIIIGGGVPQAIAKVDTRTVEDYQCWVNCNYFEDEEEASEKAIAMSKLLKGVK